jgi:hypothetical protein
MARPPRLAPFDACIACYRGDTTTALAFRGEAEWILAGLHVLGLSEDEAYAALRRALEDEGWEGAPDEVPRGTLVKAFCVCKDCAKKAAGWPVGVTSEGYLPVIEAPRGDA